MSCGTEGHFLVGTVILGLITIFKKGQASSAFESLKFASLSKFQMDVRPHVQMRWRTGALCWVSTGDADILSSFDMKDEPAFKPLQWNLAFFPVRASRYPLYLRQQTQGSSHIPIAEGTLLLRCLWKVGLPLQSKTGNHTHPETILAAQNFPQVAILKLMILYTWEGHLN